MYAKYAVFFILITAILAAGTGRAAVNIEMIGDSSYNPGEAHIDSELRITFNEYLTKETSWIYVLMNDESTERGSVSLETYLHDEDYYEFKNQTFSYNITADGTVYWNEYVDQSFQYIVSVYGECGTETQCIIGGTDVCTEDCGICNATGDAWYGGYPCPWSLSRTSYRTDFVDGNPVRTGLKFIEDASKSFGIPDKAGNIVWLIQEHPQNPDDVDIRMGAVCGSSNSPVTDYDGVYVTETGWVFRELPDVYGGKECVIQGTDCVIELMPFDDQSLEQNYLRFGNTGIIAYPTGGIYKKGVVDQNPKYQVRGVDVNWDGNTGEVILKDYDPGAKYYAVYLPPNGPFVCAYTSFSIPKSDDWEKAKEVTGVSAGYGEPYTRSYSEDELQGFSSLRKPDCYYDEEILCTYETTYDAVKSYDPDDFVDFSSAYSGGLLSVTGIVDSKVLAGYQSFIVNLSGFNIGISDITEEPGNYTMTVVLMDGSATQSERTFDLFVCTDADGDGYCVENGDCDDTKPLFNPGMNESCNGADDDCDGEIDEGIVGMGERLGQACNNWPGSVCAGTWVCNTDGTGLVCKSLTRVNPGDMEEVCDNMLDDDCDGIVDENGGVINNITQPPCLNETVWCVEGQVRSCGECRDGKRTCVNGKWSDECLGASSPKAETCNRIDDDCDGKVDNIFGKESVDETSCRCYGGNAPAVESCNGIDDDCNGEIDENCPCIDGTTETCGTDIGACDLGIRKCEKGTWGPCTGSKQPEPKDICCNDIDDDCDGQVDEGCSGSQCVAEGGEMSILYWGMIGFGSLLIFCVLIYLEFFKKKELV